MKNDLCSRPDCRARLSELKMLRKYARMLTRPLFAFARENSDAELYSTCEEVVRVLDGLEKCDPPVADA